MGQAKLNEKKRNAINESILRADVDGVSKAIIKIASAASDKFGADCLIHSSFAKELLKDQGVEAKINIGYAAWRVGDGDGDVILHKQIDNRPPQPGHLQYHAWLTVGDYILDFTTYQLTWKAKKLDESDGQTTSVDWAPNYLMTKKETVNSFNEVRMLKAGMYYYEQDAALEAKVMENYKGADPEDLSALRVIYNNPDVIVSGVASSSNRI